MYTKTFRSDLELWIQVAGASLHRGNGVESSRLHALQMMIETRIGFDIPEEAKHLPLMHHLCRLCEFGKELGTANEKNIFIHIMIDMMTATLRFLPSDKAAPTEIPSWLQQMYSDGKDFDEPNPPEDSPEYLIPPADMGDIPF